MRIERWAEIRRLHALEKQSKEAIAKALNCSHKTVKKALEITDPVALKSAPRDSIVQPYREHIEALLRKYPRLSAIRVQEEIEKPEVGYTGSVYPIRRLLRTLRPPHQRIYQEVDHPPADAVQIDWGTCGFVRCGDSLRRVYVFVAVLCFSRLCFLKFSLSRSLGHALRAIVQAFAFFGGTTRKIIFDNFKPGILDGHGRHARLHPRFQALCAYYDVIPIACAPDDPESKGVVEASVKYVKKNALAGRDEELKTFDDYVKLSAYWPDAIANVREHASTHEQPILRVEKERPLLGAIPDLPFDTDDDLPTVVSSHCRVQFETNRYSVPPAYARRPVAIRANDQFLWVCAEGKEIARHLRCYDKNKILCLTEHRLAALQCRHRARASDLENQFDAWGPEARAFHLKLHTLPVRKSVHLRKLVELARLYGLQPVRQALRLALEAQAYDAAAVENLLLQERRRHQLPSPLPPKPKRRELIEDIDLPQPDPSVYDRIFGIDL